MAALGRGGGEKPIVDGGVDDRGDGPVIELFDPGFDIVGNGDQVVGPLGSQIVPTAKGRNKRQPTSGRYSPTPIMMSVAPQVTGRGEQIAEMKLVRFGNNTFGFGAGDTDDQIETAQVKRFECVGHERGQIFMLIA